MKCTTKGILIACLWICAVCVLYFAANVELARKISYAFTYRAEMQQVIAVQNRQDIQKAELVVSARPQNAPKFIVYINKTHQLTDIELIQMASDIGKNIDTVFTQEVANKKYMRMEDVYVVIYLFGMEMPIVRAWRKYDFPENAKQPDWTTSYEGITYKWVVEKAE